MLQVKVCKTSLKMFFLISTSLKGQSDSFQQKINFHLGFMFLSITFELFQINKCNQHPTKINHIYSTFPNLL